MASSKFSDLLRHVVDTSKPGDPASVLKAVDTHSGGGYSRMHIGADKGSILDEIVRKANPKRVLELGAFFGYSAIRIARLMTAKDAELITLEIEAEHANAARELIALAGLADKVTVIKGTAAASLKKLSGTFDLILVDHWSEHYFEDIRAIEDLGLMHKGTVVVADNAVAHAHEMGDYLDHMRNSGLYDSELRKAKRDGMEVSIFRGR